MSATHEVELLTFAELLKVLGKKSRQAIYDLQRRDPTFPRPLQFGSEFSIAWRKAEIIAWLDARPRAVLTGLNAVERRRQAKERAAP